MLFEAPPSRFRAACDKCSATLAFGATDAARARGDLKMMGWREAAETGSGDARLLLCPACATSAPKLARQTAPG